MKYIESMGEKIMLIAIYVLFAMSIEFDQKKAASNLKKHGVSFDEAASALLDPMALIREDDDAR